MLLAHLTWFLESQKFIPEAVLGFLAKRYSLKYILDLTIDLGLQQLLKKNMLAAFLDIKKAYDNVTRGLVMRQLGE